MPLPNTSVPGAPRRVKRTLLRDVTMPRWLDSAARARGPRPRRRTAGFLITRRSSLKPAQRDQTTIEG